MLKGKKIILGVTGGISAYKTPQLVRLFIKSGAEVKVVATQHAFQFVTPLTLETVSKHKVYKDMFESVNEYSTEHIAYADWADLLIVAPATANCIGKYASGIADDVLSTLLLAFSKQVYLCPAMNTNMYQNFSVQRNIQYLRNQGVLFVEPLVGELACGYEGKGRMEEPEGIVEYIQENLSLQSEYRGKTILVTAGPTYEKIDAVRFVGNFSTGKMGFAIAEELASRGARVLLISGPTHLHVNNSNIERIDVVSAKEMYDAVIHNFLQCDAAILSAAVADFRPETTYSKKMKKTSNTQTIELSLVQNPDILETLGKMKTAAQRLVGFALETDNEVLNAKHKIEKKNLDFIVLNSLQDAGAGFGCDTNKISLIDRDGKIESGVLKPKREVAKDIVNKLKCLLK